LATIARQNAHTRKFGGKIFTQQAFRRKKYQKERRGLKNEQPFSSN